jgi:hypothetical protein
MAAAVPGLLALVRQLGDTRGGTRRPVHRWTSRPRVPVCLRASV